MVKRTAPKPIPVIDAALQQYKPKLAEEFRLHVTRTFDRLVAMYGPKLKDLYRGGHDRNALADRRAHRGLLAPLLKHVQDEGGGYDEYHFVINEDRLDQYAADYADRVVASWRAKIYDKVGRIESASVERLNGFAFDVVGTYKGHRVLLEQQMILNVSGKGTLYNQFPARIYVDGKFTPATAFKTM